MKQDIALTGGSGQPVFEAQATFRLLMDSTAQPGLRQTVQADDGTRRSRTSAGGADADPRRRHTPVWVDAPTPDLTAWIAFHTGARLTDRPGDAAFALLGRVVAPCRTACRLARRTIPTARPPW